MKIEKVGPTEPYTVEDYKYFNQALKLDRTDEDDIYLELEFIHRTFNIYSE